MLCDFPSKWARHKEIIKTKPKVCCHAVSSLCLCTWLACVCICIHAHDVMLVLAHMSCVSSLFVFLHLIYCLSCLKLLASESAFVSIHPQHFNDYGFLCMCIHAYIYMCVCCFVCVTVSGGWGGGNKLCWDAWAYKVYLILEFTCHCMLMYMHSFTWYESVWLDVLLCFKIDSLS